MKDQLDRIEGQISDIHEILLGNGTPEKGIVMRVASLEQDKRRLSKIVVVIGGGLATILGSWFKDWIIGKHHP